MCVQIYVYIYTINCIPLLITEAQCDDLITLVRNKRQNLLKLKYFKAVCRSYQIDVNVFK